LTSRSSTPGRVSDRVDVVESPTASFMVWLPIEFLYSLFDWHLGLATVISLHLHSYNLVSCGYDYILSFVVCVGDLPTYFKVFEKKTHLICLI
jgi:hypothetical protein